MPVIGTSAAVRLEFLAACSAEPGSAEACHVIAVGLDHLLGTGSALGAWHDAVLRQPFAKELVVLLVDARVRETIDRAVALYAVSQLRIHAPEAVAHVRLRSQADDNLIPAMPAATVFRVGSQVAPSALSLGRVQLDSIFDVDVLPDRTRELDHVRHLQVGSRAVAYQRPVLGSAVFG